MPAWKVEHEIMARYSVIAISIYCLKIAVIDIICVKTSLLRNILQTF